MRVVILSVADIRHMTPSSVYKKYFETRGIEYDVICCDRYNANKSKRNHFFFKWNGDLSMSKKRKIIQYLKFRNFAKRIIIKNNYDFIVVWNENTAALFSDFLLFKYKNKYCVNLRDEFQQQKILKKIIFKSLDYSVFITKPTPEWFFGYDKKTFCLYNKDSTLASSFHKKTSFRENDKPIRLTHLGFYSKAKKASIELSDKFGNDTRYELFFYGQGFDTELRSYIEKKGYTNIYTFGAFPYEDTAKILENTDVINSYYNDFSHPSLRLSFGIKHSYTPMLYIPGLADEDTCWGRMSKDYNLAYLVNSNNIKTLPDDLYKWYRSMNYEDFCSRCNQFNQIIDDSQTVLYKKLDKALKIHEDKT